MSPSARGVVTRLARPAGVALDRRFDAFEQRLSARLDRLEELLGVETDAAADLNLALRRTLTRLEARLADLERRMADPGPG